MTETEPTPLADWIDSARTFIRDGGAAQHADIAASASPRAAVIAASDFPLDPTTLTGAAPGEIYDIRTVAGLVPPSAGDGVDRSVGAALEFAIRACDVRHIILLAHPDCGLIRSLIDENAPGTGAIAHGQFLPSWTRLAAASLDRVLNAKISDDERARHCCQEIMRLSFENLMTYQWVLDPVFDGKLILHGWYCDARNGVFAKFDPGEDEFVTD